MYILYTSTVFLVLQPINGAAVCFTCKVVELVLLKTTMSTYQPNTT